MKLARNRYIELTVEEQENVVKHRLKEVELELFQLDMQVLELNACLTSPLSSKAKLEFEQGLAIAKEKVEYANQRRNALVAMMPIRATDKAEPQG